MAILPGFLCMVMLSSMPAEKVFLYLFLPSLVAIPSYYYMPLIGLPDLNFFHFAEIPLFAWWLIKGSKDYKFSFMDFIVLSYVGVSIFSEFATMGAKDGLNIIIDRQVQIIIPYLLMKHFFQYPSLRISILKVLVVAGAILAFMSLPQFKFDISITDPLSWIWPEKLSWIGHARYGYVRVSATFAHPILAGLMWTFFSLFAIWLDKQKVWANNWMGKALIIFNIAGLMMSISRGPILGFFAGLVLLYIGWSENRSKSLMIVMALSIVMIPPMVVKFIAYISVDRYSATTETQENAAYRRELMENYIEVIKERPWLGFGRNGIPVVRSQKSVDNQYIYIALLHGVVAMYLFLFMTLFMVIKLLNYGWKHPPDHGQGQLAWLLAGCAGTWLLTLATVWMGAQSEQMVFMLAAMGDTIGKELHYEKAEMDFMIENIEESEWSFQRVL